VGPLGSPAPYFRSHKLSAISVEEIDRYRVSKVREREQKLVERPLSNGSINKTIAILGAVLDAAVEYRHIASNPARGKRRRLKAAKPRRTWLEIDEVQALLGAAGEHRALLATMTLAGLRVGEAVSLRWRDVDLARGVLRVSESKTDAGVRTVDLSPDLLDELKAHKAQARSADPDGLVFPTRIGTARNRSNVRRHVLARAIDRANKARKKSGRAPVQEGVTNHTLRRTFASLLYEAGASPAYVMAQMGHTSSALALEVYARKMERQRDTGARMDALLKGADWAQAGTNGTSTAESLPAEETAGDAIPLAEPV
jgi:integrase